MHANRILWHELQVKNVDRIELGRYEMETWYFSPLPDKFRDCKVQPSAPDTNL